MGVSAGLLVRISADRAGEGLGVERQEVDCRELAARRGWDVVRVYREQDTSAYQRRKVRLPDGSTALRVIRPAFREMLDDLAERRIGALVAYDLDRVARDPRDLEDLIDAVEQWGTPAIAVTGSLDLSNDAGITMARVQVAIANKSSRDTSRRVKRALTHLAERGGPHGGGPAFGYKPDRTINEAEAATVRWVHEQVAAARSMQSIARELRATHPGQRQWDSELVKRIATSPRYVGQRVHHGRVVGPATWPAIIDLATWEQSCAIIAARDHPSNQIGRPRGYALTGLLRCGRCGRTLFARGVKYGTVRFGCMPSASGRGCGGSNIRYQPVEEHVTAAALARLREQLMPVDEPDGDTPDIGGQIAALEQQQVDLGQQLADGQVSLLVVQSADRALSEKINALREQLQEGQRRRRRVVLDPVAVADAWPDYDLDQRRAILGILIDHVTVGPGRTGVNAFQPERLQVTWR